MNNVQYFFHVLWIMIATIGGITGTTVVFCVVANKIAKFYDTAEPFAKVTIIAGWCIVICMIGAGLITYLHSIFLIR